MATELPTDARRRPAPSSFASGAMAGLVTAAVLQPLDVVRTRVQGEQTNMRASFSAVVDKDGIRGLWLRGIVPTLLRASLGPGIFFQAVSSLRSSPWSNAGATSEFWIGALARGVASVAVAPLTLIKARQEWGHVQVMPQSLRECFVGLAPTLARDVPFSGVHLWCYVQLKPVDGSSRVANAAANFVAGCIATLVTHPFDVIRTRRQVGGPPVTHARELLSGFTLRMMKRPLTTAVAWVIFEELTER